MTKVCTAHFCQLLPGVNNLDRLCFCFFRRHNLLQQAGTALISSQAGHIIQIVYIQTQCNVFVCLQFECHGGEGNAHTSLHIHPVNCLYSVQGQKNRIKTLTLLTHFPSLSLFFLFVCCHFRWIRLNCFSAPTLYIALSDPLSNSNLNSQNPLSNNIDFEIKLSFYFLF